MQLRNVVPQGSILESLLFLLSKNDLKNDLSLLDLVILADDVNPLHIHENMN